MLQRICLVIVLLFTLGITANAQGTPGTLRCNLRGGLEIHASRDPGSSVIGRVQCGDAVLIIDQRFGSPHVRTEDGKDGYITSQNLGQWSIESESTASSSSSPSSTTKVASLGSPAAAPPNTSTPPDVPRSQPKPALQPAPTAPQVPPSLKSVHKIYVEKMDNDLDQYIRAEFGKQMKNIVVVLKKEDADAILTGVGDHKDGLGAAVTGRLLGLHDTATGSVSLIDKDGTVVMWSSEAGDRNLWLGVLSRGGPRKVADRLVHDLKGAMSKAE
jgi:hypothetical protein